MDRNYKLILAALGWGARIRGTELGPGHFYNSDSFKQSYLFAELSHNHSYIGPGKSIKEIEIPLGKESLPYVHSHCQQLAETAFNAVKNFDFPIIVGGDHSIAIGSWSGIIKALDAKEKFGLIWVDAHMDSHTPETTTSKAYHGMPVASLMGYGEKELVELLEFYPKVAPRHIVYIGIRSFEGGEAELLKKLGVKIFYIEDIKKLGLKKVIEESLKTVTNGTKAWGLSIDLDGFDPKDAPGTGSPVEDGIDSQEFLAEMHTLINSETLAGVEIVEFNPERDVENKTLKLIIELIKKICI